MLVLDEPTNDLDIETLELLEALLQDYVGTVFLVSHDREFLDNVVTQTIASEGQGRWKEYIGGYSDWLQQRPAADSAKGSSSTASAVSVKKNSTNQTSTVSPSAEPIAERKKASFKTQQSIDQLLAQVAALESRQALLHGQIAEPNFYQQAADKQKKAHQELAEIEAAITTALAQWEALEEKI